MTDNTTTSQEPTPTLIEGQDIPLCGLYIILSDTDDHEKQAFKLAQALHAANRFSHYNQNRHVVEYRPAKTHPAPHSPTEAEIRAYQEISARNGFIFLVHDDAMLARTVGADGVLCSSIQKATDARKLLDEGAIIGLRCSTKAAAQSAVALEFDFITIFSDKHGDSLMDILHWWATATDNPIAVEGVFDPENCQAFVRADATFIDSSHHIWTHPSGNVMQGVVNMMDAFERHKPTAKPLN